MWYSAVKTLKSERTSLFEFTKVDMNSIAILDEVTNPKVIMSLDLLGFLRSMATDIDDDVDLAYDGCSMDENEAHLSLQRIKVRADLLKAMLNHIK